MVREQAWSTALYRVIRGRGVPVSVSTVVPKVLKRASPGRVSPAPAKPDHSPRLVRSYGYQIVPALRCRKEGLVRPALIGAAPAPVGPEELHPRARWQAAPRGPVHSVWHPGKQPAAETIQRLGLERAPGAATDGLLSVSTCPTCAEGSAWPPAQHHPADSMVDPPTEPGSDIRSVGQPRPGRAA